MVGSCFHIGPSLGAGIRPPKSQVLPGTLLQTRLLWALETSCWVFLLSSIVLRLSLSYTDTHTRAHRAECQDLKIPTYKPAGQPSQGYSDPANKDDNGRIG